MTEETNSITSIFNQHTWAILSIISGNKALKVWSENYLEWFHKSFNIQLGNSSCYNKGILP